ncbi:MAG: DUF1583 domain-containing protein, partial [Isosphaeraceae bacterium]|nr:DUF1583 domain-containing protein [Isosphaeraceae bacterium]
APPVAPLEKPDRPGETRVEIGGLWQAPARELITLAKELGRLDDLAARVEACEAWNRQDQRGRLALLAMIRAAQGREDEAAACLKDLAPLLAQVGKDDPDWSRWPELLAAASLLDRPKLRAPALALLDFLVKEQIQKGHRGGLWQNWAQHERARALMLASSEAPRLSEHADPRVPGWSRVTLGTAASRGGGRPLPLWTVAQGEAKHAPGHHHDFLYFNTPLRGDFQIDCELTSFGWREGRLSYGGLMVFVLYDRKRYELSHYGRALGGGIIDPPLPEVKDYYPYRLVVRGGKYEAYVGDRKIFERRLSDEPDPWLAIYVRDSLTGGARHLRISGNPTIPDQLHLSSLSDLTGWLAEYYEESIGRPNASWEKRGEEIYGRCLAGATPPTPEPSYAYALAGGIISAQPQSLGVPPGSKQESVLQYHRPMLEDGEIAYEFYYEPGKVLVHPALDRLTFLLAPEGVQIHWMTDDKHDRTGLAPDNATIEPRNRKGPTALPLQANAWNRLVLALKGDTVSLTLNETLVYQRDLELTNQRNFGLFHYADETEVRVRNVVYRGDWPRSLPMDRDLLAAPSGSNGEKP